MQELPQQFDCELRVGRCDFFRYRVKMNGEIFVQNWDPIPIYCASRSLDGSQALSYRIGKFLCALEVL